MPGSSAGIVIQGTRAANETEDSGASNAQRVARRLLIPEGAPASLAGRAVGDDLQQTCSRVCTNLCDALGDDGCTALLARALARTEGRYPALTSLRRIRRGVITLDNVAEGTEKHGAAATTTAIEALFAALIEILATLIGEEMAIRIMELRASQAGRGRSASSK